MPRSTWLIVLVVLGSCKTTTPSGYRHVGRKTVYIRTPQPKNYNDAAALYATRESVAKHSGLFRIVDSLDEAELDMLVTGNVTTKLAADADAGWGGQHFKLDTPTDADPEHKSYLAMLIVHREAGVIYRADRAVSNPGRQDANAKVLLKLYRKGMK